jgi:1,4-alpha-glucan branching enzyme
MLYLDYSRQDGEWIPNPYGGRENIEAIGFLRRFNETVYGEYPDVQTIAEESTAWPMVSRPVHLGGLGFGLKWNMGWMHDTLDYVSREPVHRKYHHNQLTFSMLYAFNENFILPLSHDEVVHGKGSLLNKIPGDDWQKFATLRLLYGYLYCHPGKKLLFMGGEIGQWNEWNHDTSLDWHLLEYDTHKGLRLWLGDLNALYRSQPALYERDFSIEGFQWIECNDIDQSLFYFMRKGADQRNVVVAVCNFTPVPRHYMRVGVPCPGFWRETLNSDAPSYGGCGLGNYGGCESEWVWAHGMPQSICITIPPLAIVIFSRTVES